jgi:hypothetical protein
MATYQPPLGSVLRTNDNDNVSALDHGFNPNEQLFFGDTSLTTAACQPVAAE